MHVIKSFAEEKRGILYVVGTPIGNLQDMSPRALEILSEVDLIAAEDTRHTRKLLQVFQFHTELISYHEHNKRERGAQLLNQLLEGKKIALVSDAGMPGISDPGEELVRDAVQHQIPVVPIPGPNAALAALVASGLPTQPFLFIGFLPRSTKERRAQLQRWARTPATLLFYESPHRITEMLADLRQVMGNRRLAICRELTKKHEEWLRGDIDRCLDYLKEHGARGEYTIVVSGDLQEEEESQEEAWWESLAIEDHVEIYIKKGMSKKEAIAQTAKDRSLPKREVYNTYHRN
ncbi:MULTISPECIES: 16S rRNA (cytidine(1402)-2'-O)-methyltransferase [Thermoactinomyces]|uniref:Ribosomal RNA small subunit methyltransferase I n=1 Tax=Thermoactinomyces daqus TaxID=1329516 RepID=A0A7W1X9G3_9BACL|nr:MULTISPECIES: 16S rRNA (cytidine(1402)-2'-O)-methyltransferase [Thermoactinomyces]MBA4542465.1 16S rRNA (cytidine(1402)-2'-O)-methyltransferase [Thermoactinomyces daqus]MBH8598746.1 16S rRNA (cytidine(1402)-2'-O)-methyltransferase [Thermoactinomyces sp. CICC 10523]MBH8604731.1 16S rRNA (cytidine(1402)-2'-O)-methyltransferase [Thermoactinomyces sp. CICC 10522]MBH8607443.1 16S rRNA (cytidine(1402)-2'-O)-methyltransferase [Thermoactinomyces sp. CICC 10521]